MPARDLQVISGAEVNALAVHLPETVAKAVFTAIINSSVIFEYCVVSFFPPLIFLLKGGSRGHSLIRMMDSESLSPIQFVTGRTFCMFLSTINSISFFRGNCSPGSAKHGGTSD